MAVKLSPIGNDAPFLDANGNPLSGGKLHTYEAGSSTNEATYTDSGGGTANANPIILNSNGYPASGGSVVGIWLTEGQAYKFVLKTSADVEVWSRDNISGINDTDAVANEEWVASGLTPTFVSSTQFTLTGDQTTEFHVGRKLKVTDGSGTKYCRITVSAFTTVTTVTVEGDALATPTSAVSYGIIRRTDTSLPAIEDDELVIVDPVDPTKRLRIDVGNIPTATTIVAATGAGGLLPAGIGPLPYSGSTIPSGWLECDGSAVSRTTYAALFTAIGTTWGVGDGATTFNLPAGSGKGIIGDGTGTLVDDGEDADVDTTNDTLTVPTNTHKWVTGMAVVFNLTSGTITGLVDNTTYYVIRASTTTIKLASTLANAQNGTNIDLTAKSSPVWDITYNLTARTLGEYGGAESKAMSSTELLPHTHGVTASTAAGGANSRVEGLTTSNTDATKAAAAIADSGGNAAMAIMNPFLVTKYIISY